MTPVCIVAYKNPAALARCITTLPPGCAVLIHDNTTDNLGYTRGMNKLLGPLLMKDYPYAVLLNQDVQLRPGAIENAIAFMDQHPRCAIAGFKLLNSANPDEITHGGTGSPYPAGEHLIGRVSEGDCDRPRAFLWVNMAASIVRMEALREFGVMDERFFLIGSDSDWCMAAWMKGWEVWYCPQSEALHDCDGCSSSPTPEQLEIASKDMKEWGIKWSHTLSDPNNLIGDTTHALQERCPAEVLPRQQGQTGEARSERRGVGPSI